MSVNFLGYSFYGWYVISGKRSQVRQNLKLWVVQFDRASGPFQWSPFEFVERRYFLGEPEDFFLSLDIFRKLKC